MTPLHGLAPAAALTVVAALVAGCGPEADPDRGDAAPARPAAAVGSATSAAPAVAMSETRTFRAWSVTCDNGQACMAWGGVDDYASGWLRVAYSPGPRGEAEVAVGFWGEDGGEIEGPITLSIDGRTFTARPVAERSGHFVTDGLAVARALAQARRISASADGAVALSADGAAAALLWIDERQGRLGTTTALVRTGDRPAATVPPAPALPRVIAAPAVDQGDYAPSDEAARTPGLPPALAQAPEVIACREANSYNPYLATTIQAARLDARRELWVLPCGSGAYNITNIVFVTGPGGVDPRLVHFPSVMSSDPDDPTDTQLTNADYDPETRVIHQFAKGRGIGDCGVISSWTWTGREFVLSEERVMGDCQGMPADLWPTTWRTR